MMRVLITRPRAQANAFAEALQAIGAEPIFLPTITIRPTEDTTELDGAFSRLTDYDWLILTSASAADAVLGRMTALGVGAIPQNLRVAAIGPKTAARLEEGGITPNFVPNKHIAEAIIPGLGLLNDRRVLLPMADIAHDTLPKAIQEAGGIAHVIAAYHTVPAEPDPQGVAALRAGVDVITFTSGSTVRNFLTLAKNLGLDPLHLPNNPKTACIGPKTAETVRELGLGVDIVADPHTTDGLVAQIKNELILK